MIARLKIRQRLRGVMLRAIFAFLRRYMQGRAVDMETQKSIQSGTISGSTVVWHPTEPFPTDLIYFWMPEGGMIGDVKRVSYVQMKSVPGAGPGLAKWRFYE